MINKEEIRKEFRILGEDPSEVPTVTSISKLPVTKENMEALAQKYPEMAEQIGKVYEGKTEREWKNYDFFEGTIKVDGKEVQFINFICSSSGTKDNLYATIYGDNYIILPNRGIEMFYLGNQARVKPDEYLTYKQVSSLYGSNSKVTLERHGLYYKTRFGLDYKSPDSNEKYTFSASGCQYYGLFGKQKLENVPDLFRGLFTQIESGIEDKTRENKAFHGMLFDADVKKTLLRAYILQKRGKDFYDFTLYVLNKETGKYQTYKRVNPSQQWEKKMRLTDAPEITMAELEEIINEAMPEVVKLDEMVKPVYHDFKRYNIPVEIRTIAAECIKFVAREQGISEDKFPEVIGKIERGITEASLDIRRHYSPGNTVSVNSGGFGEPARYKFFNKMPETPIFLDEMPEIPIFLDGMPGIHLGMKYGQVRRMAADLTSEEMREVQELIERIKGHIRPEHGEDEPMPSPEE